MNTTTEFPVKPEKAVTLLLEQGITLTEQEVLRILKLLALLADIYLDDSREV